MCGLRRDAEQRSLRSGKVTLGELLAVFLITAVVAYLILPMLARARVPSCGSTCRNKLLQFYQGIRMYVNNNEDYFPAAFLVDPKGNASDLSNLTFYRFLLHEYCETNFRRTWMPTDDETIPMKFQRDQSFWQDVKQGSTKDYFAPLLVFRGPMSGNGLALPGTAPFEGNAPFPELTKDAAPTDRPLFSDVNVSLPNAEAQDTKDPAHELAMRKGFSFVRYSGIDVFVGVGRSATDYGTSRFDFRHGDSDRANFLFLDGHVESVKSTDAKRLMRIYDRWNHLAPEDKDR